MENVKSTAVGGAQLASPASPIQSASMELDKEISMLHDTISSLENRLRPIISPRPQNDSTVENEVGGSELRTDYVNKARTVRHASGRLQELLEILEV